MTTQDDFLGWLAGQDEATKGYFERLERIRTQYPAFAQMLQVPEIAEILGTAMDQKLGANEVQQAIQGSTWYRETPEAARKWRLQLALDPAEAWATAQRQSDIIRTTAGQMGAGFSDHDLFWLSLDVLHNGKSEVQMRELIVDRAFPGYQQGQQMQGEFAAGMSRNREYAKAMGLNLGDDVLYGWSRDILAGRKTEDGFKEQMKTQAKGAYSHLASQIDAGSTVADVFEGYRQQAARTLGIAAESIDMTDPKWIKAISYDDGSGRRMMNNDEWERTIRKGPEYGFEWSQTGKTEAAQYGYSLLQTMGRR